MILHLYRMDYSQLSYTSQETDPLPTLTQGVVFQISVCLTSKTLVITQMLNSQFDNPVPIDSADLHVVRLRTADIICELKPLPLLNCHLGAQGRAAPGEGEM